MKEKHIVSNEPRYLVPLTYSGETIDYLIFRDKEKAEKHIKSENFEEEHLESNCRFLDPIEVYGGYMIARFYQAELEYKLFFEKKEDAIEELNKLNRRKQTEKISYELLGNIYELETEEKKYEYKEDDA